MNKIKTAILSLRLLLKDFNSHLLYGVGGLLVQVPGVPRYVGGGGGRRGYEEALPEAGGHHAEHGLGHGDHVDPRHHLLGLGKVRHLQSVENKFIGKLFTLHLKFHSSAVLDLEVEVRSPESGRARQTK